MSSRAIAGGRADAKSMHGNQLKDLAYGSGSSYLGTRLIMLQPPDQFVQTAASLPSYPAQRKAGPQFLGMVSRSDLAALLRLPHFVCFFVCYHNKLCPRPNTGHILAYHSSSKDSSSLLARHCL